MSLVQGVFAVTNILGTFSIFKLVGIFFERYEVNKRIEIFSYSLYYILSSLIFILFPIPALILVFNLISIFALTFNYAGTVKSRIMAAIYVYLILFVIELIFMALFEYRKIFIFKMQEFHSVYLIICIKFAMYLAALVLSEKKVNLSKNRDVPTLYWVGIVSIPVAGLLVMLLLLSIAGETEQILILLVVSALAIINIVSFQLYNYIITMLDEKNKKLILQKQNESYLQQLKMIQADNANMSLIRHDIKNHLLVLKSLYDKEATEAGRTYLNDILTGMDKSDELCKSGNVTVDSIINYKLREISREYVGIDVCIPEKINVSDMDITAMLGNLLDNAVRAVKETKENPYLYLSLSYTRGRLMLRMENSYRDIKLSKGGFQTTKQDRRGHGIGLESVREVISKYNGMLQIDCESGNFVVEAVLYC